MIEATQEIQTVFKTSAELVPKDYKGSRTVASCLKDYGYIKSELLTLPLTPALSS